MTVASFIIKHTNHHYLQKMERDEEDSLRSLSKIIAKYNTKIEAIYTAIEVLKKEVPKLVDERAVSLIARGKLNEKIERGLINVRPAYSIGPQITEEYYNCYGCHTRTHHTTTKYWAGYCEGKGHQDDSQKSFCSLACAIIWHARNCDTHY